MGEQTAIALPATRATPQHTLVMAAIIKVRWSSTTRKRALRTLPSVVRIAIPTEEAEINQLLTNFNVTY